MLAVAGLTATVTVPEGVGVGFGVGVGVLGPEKVLPQAVSANAVNKSKEPASTGRIRGFCGWGKNETTDQQYRKGTAEFAQFSVGRCRESVSDEEDEEMSTVVEF